MARVCRTCGTKIYFFTSTIFEKEFGLSGECEKCQRRVFMPSEEWADWPHPVIIDHLGREIKLDCTQPDWEEKYEEIRLQSEAG
jgi:hypothetical protein